MAGPPLPVSTVPHPLPLHTHKAHDPSQSQSFTDIARVRPIISETTPPSFHFQILPTASSAYFFSKSHVYRRSPSNLSMDMVVLLTGLKVKLGGRYSNPSGGHESLKSAVQC